MYDLNWFIYDKISLQVYAMNQSLVKNIRIEPLVTSKTTKETVQLFYEINTWRPSHIYYFLVYILTESPWDDLLVFI